MIDIESYDGAREYELLLKKRRDLKGSRDIYVRRAKVSDVEEKRRLRNLISAWTAAQGRVDAYEYDIPRLEVEHTIARLKGQRGLVEVNQRLLDQTRRSLEEWKPKAIEAKEALEAQLGDIEG